MMRFFALALGLFLFSSWASAYFIDWLWFQEVGFRPVFFKSLTFKLGAAVVGGLLFGLTLFGNLWLAMRDATIMLPPELIPFPYARWLRRRGVLLASLVVSGFIGLIVGATVGNRWLTFLLFQNRGDFGVADPLFHLDVGFYVFVLPAATLVLGLISAAIVLSLVLSAAVYGITGRITVSGRWVNLHPRARAHLFTLLGAYFMVKAVGYLLSMYSLVYSPRGVSYGASYTDISAQLPGLKVLALMSVVLGLIALANMVWRQQKLLIGGAVVLLVGSVIVNGVLPGLIQQFVVGPNELAKETPFIRYTIEYTRKAYGLEGVVEREFPVASGLTRADLDGEPGTIENVRLWDWRVLQSIYPQIQGMRQYYAFKDVDVDRYVIDGRLRQVVLSAREIDYDALPGKTWINNHLKFTHGYGLVMGPAAEISAEGVPVLWVRDIPPTTAKGLDAPELRVTRPEIYFGELTNTYAIVNTAEEEFDYPQGDSNAYTTYTGKGGIPVGGLLYRLAFALRTGDYNVLFSRAIVPESRVIIYRNIRQRVEKIAPFLLYDHDPYLVLADGRLQWIQDAYTITNAYPYAEPYRTAGGPRFNYIRNSVKVVVDAYDGTMSFYVADPDDPLIAAYRRSFPGLFRPIEDMSPELRKHLRYPEDLFLAQTAQYAKYHMQDPAVFYNMEDLWLYPQEIVDSEKVTMDPYYVIMQLPGEESPEFLLMLPFTPPKRQNMIAWMAARADGERYGELVVFKFPKQKVVYGPEQIEAFIGQDDEIAKNFSLWGQQDTRVKRGNLLVIPIADSIIYVEPIYLESQATRVPELRRVVVAHGNRVVMEETLGEALDALFGTPEVAAGTPAGVAERPGGVPSPGAPSPGQPPRGMSELLAEADRLYREAEAALRSGDWAGYGDRIKRLGEVIRNLRGQAPAGSD